MSVAFNAIPGNLLVPFAYFEINSGGSPFQGNPRLLLVGQKTAAGAAVADVPFGPIQSEAEAIEQFGIGSMLVDMYRIARTNAPFQPIWALPLADPAGSKAAGSIIIEAAPAVTGAGVLYVVGRRLTFQVNAADTAATVAASIAAAINAAVLPVTAAVNGVDDTVVDITARHNGLLSNGLELARVTTEPNVLTAANTTIVALVGGTGTPELDDALANLGDDEFDFIAGPYADSTSLNSVRDALDGINGRWSPIKQLYGHYFSANFGTLSANATLGAARNDGHVSIISSQTSPTPTWQWAAGLAAVASAHLSDAPELSRPLQTLPIKDLQPPRDRSKWWDTDDRQALYVDGLSAYTVSADGIVKIDRVTTTYKKTAANAPDATFRDVETMFQTVFATRYLRTSVQQKHSRQALANDNPFNLAEIATPKSVRNTLIHAYNDLVALGVAEDAETFAQFVQVERDPNDATRLNAGIPLNTVNQLRVFAANVTIYLEYRSASGQPLV